MTLDPVSDMLTSIRNGQKARLHSVATPASNLKGEIARVMKEAGYIADAVTTNSLSASFAKAILAILTCQSFSMKKILSFIYQVVARPLKCVLHNNTVFILEFVTAIYRL